MADLLGSITVWYHYNVVNFLTNIQKKTPHTLPARARYGVYFVDSASEWYSVSVPAIIYAISYYVGPHYNCIRLYFAKKLCNDNIHNFFFKTLFSSGFVALQSASLVAAVYMEIAQWNNIIKCSWMIYAIRYATPLSFTILIAFTVWNSYI